jgi:hypothetical protein
MLGPEALRGTPANEGPNLPDGLRGEPIRDGVHREPQALSLSLLVYEAKGIAEDNETADAS